MNKDGAGTLACLLRPIVCMNIQGVLSEPGGFLTGAIEGIAGWGRWGRQSGKGKWRVERREKEGNGKGGRAGKGKRGREGEGWEGKEVRRMRDRKSGKRKKGREGKEGKGKKGRGGREREEWGQEGSGWKPELRLTLCRLQIRLCNVKFWNSCVEKTKFYNLMYYKADKQRLRQCRL
jgi:hypothetical protein